MSDDVNVTVSEETPIAVTVVDIEPFSVTVSEDAPINTVYAPDEAIEITVEDKEVIAIELNILEGALLRFHTEILETDGEETSFLLDHSFLAGSLAVYKNGILATDEYVEKIGRTGVDFATAPASDDIYEARYAYI